MRPQKSNLQYRELVQWMKRTSEYNISEYKKDHRINVLSNSNDVVGLELLVTVASK